MKLSIDNFNGFNDGNDYVPVKPEDEMFHSVYIGHTIRSNHIGVVEQPGLLQVRGIDYNKSEVNMVVTLVKSILSKYDSDAKQKVCSSFKEGAPPYYGCTKENENSEEFRICGTTKNTRILNPYCKDCKTELIVNGIYCDTEGRPIYNDDNDDKKLQFVFIVGKGVRYIGVSDYVNSFNQLDNLTRLVEVPPNEDPERIWIKEKSSVSISRFVTKVTITQYKTKSYGIKNVFKLTMGKQLPDSEIPKILKVGSESKEEFIKKFNWGKNKIERYKTNSNSSYKNTNSVSVETESPVSKPPTNNNVAGEKSETQISTVTYDDIQF